MKNVKMQENSYKEKTALKNKSQFTDKDTDSDYIDSGGKEKVMFSADENIYAHFFKENSEVILLINQKTDRVVDANRSACRFYGWSHEEITCKAISDINFLSPKEVNDEIEKAKEENRKYLLLKHILANGQVREVEVYHGLIGPEKNGLIYYIVHDITEHELVHDSLKKKRMEISAVQKLRGIGKWEIDLISGKVTISEETKRIFGLESKIFTTESIREIPLPQYLPVLDKAQDELVERNVPYDVQFKIRRPNDGKIRILHAVAEYYSKKKTIIGILHDITELEHTKNELQERKSLLNEVGKIAHAGGWELDASTNLITWTFEVARIHGLGGNRTIELKSLLNHYPSSSREILEDSLKMALKEGRGFDIELKLVSTIEKNKWVHIIGHPRIDDGRIVKINGSIQDITEQKKAEIRIAEEAQWRRILMEGSRDGIVIVDNKGNIVEANPRYAEMMGHSQEEIRTMNLWERDIHNTHEFMQKVTRHSDPAGALYETRQERKDGTFINIEINANTALFGEKEMTFCVCRDISLRKKFERELLAAKIAAETANRTKSEFLAIMSHELRTPLTSIIGFSDVMLDGVGGTLSEKQTVYMNHVLNAGKHLLELINDILDLSKVEAGESELSYEQFDVSQAISIMVDGLSPQAAKKDIHLKIDVEPGLKNINADRTKFKQIVTNLLSNAIKFSSENSNVNIRAETSDNWLLISVKDTGIGIASIDMHKLFQPFKQLNPHLNRKHEGTGLGLALSKKFVELHGGKIWAESKPGKGSIFTFTIPVSPKKDI